ncbi:uncharacterized protein LOC142968233 [Anarhichas minor]|uniref:uncharacterized protein LOC142968233 n=1 Tax=Anarhichas minor TaxID=65739 RepID=UPI003F7397E1
MTTGQDAPQGSLSSQQEAAVRMLLTGPLQCSYFGPPQHYRVSVDLHKLDSLWLLTHLNVAQVAVDASDRSQQQTGQTCAAVSSTCSTYYGSTVICPALRPCRKQWRSIFPLDRPAGGADEQSHGLRSQAGSAGSLLHDSGQMAKCLSAVFGCGALSILLRSLSVAVQLQDLTPHHSKLLLQDDKTPETRPAPPDGELSSGSSSCSPPAPPADVAPASSSSAKEVASQPKSSALQGKWLQEPRSLLISLLTEGQARISKKKLEYVTASCFKLQIHHIKSVLNQNDRSP